VQKENPSAKLGVIHLGKIDFWYWCSSFIDLYEICPFNCIYCNTQNSCVKYEVEYANFLPEDREVVGLGLLSDIFSPFPSSDDQVGSILEFLYRENYPVNIVTKSENILNHIPLLKKFSRKGHIRVTITILTPSRELSKEIEGFSPNPERRIEVLRQLNSENIPSGMAITPIIPGVNGDFSSLDKLVGAAKKAGSKWVLFSGYTPVSSFFNTETGKKVFKLFQNHKVLEDKYIQIKKHLLGRLIQESLPIRIPRITFNTSHIKYYSAKVSEYLFNISYFYELLGDRLGMKRFRRAGYQINALEQPLKMLVTRKKLGYIKGINPEIEKVINEVLFYGRSTLYTKLYKALSKEF